MYYIESPLTDPYMNLALEQYIFENLDRSSAYCMLWQNDNAVIVGKHQNTFAEINRQYVTAHGIKVVRRLSGGGAVYHDMGNINYTFIAKDDSDGSFDFSTFCTPVLKVLQTLGAQPELSGRNDMTIDGRKFSGNSQYMRGGRVMHHGTIMFDSNLETVQQALNVPKDKLQSKGLRSVRSRVTNVKPHLSRKVSTKEFFSILRDFLFREYGLIPYELTAEDWKAVQKLCDTIYARWEWNYGRSPSFAVVKERRVEGVGKLEIHMDAENGVISGIAFFGDYFGNGDTSELASLLIGRKLEEFDLYDALDKVEINRYFAHLDRKTFIEILLS